MIESAKKMLLKAKQNKYSVAQINTNNLEWTKLILEVAQELKSPIIIGVSDGAARYMGGYKTVSNLVRNIHDELNITVPVAIHLDHGSFDACFKAAKAGFTSIMFDGSSLPIAENLEKTKQIVKLAKKYKLSVEAEVGGIGGEEDGKTSMGEIASPAEASEIAKLGIDFLAAGIGNIHGVYPEDWQGLNFEALKEIEQAVFGMPLVLHGGTGIPEEQIKKAISLGVSKINVNTELQIAFSKGVRKYIEDKKDLEGKGFDPRKILKPGVELAKQIVRDKILMFGSNNQAGK